MILLNKMRKIYQMLNVVKHFIQFLIEIEASNKVFSMSLVIHHQNANQTTKPQSRGARQNQTKYNNITPSQYCEYLSNN